MQDPDHAHALGDRGEEHVAADAVAAVALANLVAGATAARMVGDALDSGADLLQVGLGLAGVPALVGVAPDRRGRAVPLG